MTTLEDVTCQAGRIYQELDVVSIRNNFDTLEAAVTDLEAGVLKVSTTTVTFANTGATTLYTVPAGKSFIPVMAFIRATADVGVTDITSGQVGALTDWLTTRHLSNLNAAGDCTKIEIINSTTPAKTVIYAAETVFQIDVTVAGGGAGSHYVDLFGYLV